VEFDFSAPVFEWRGPAPYYFVTVPDEPSEELHALSALVTYGWGMIPVQASIGATTWTTSLFAKDGRYVVPLKVAVRRAERIEPGDVVHLVLTVEV